MLSLPASWSLDKHFSRESLSRVTGYEPLKGTGKRLVTSKSPSPRTWPPLAEGRDVFGSERVS